MDDITLTYGDAYTVEENEDGWAVRIQNRAFVEEPRWLGCDVGGGGGDREMYLNGLIRALEELRDRK